ncbi:MAG: gamma-glutamylcyclotransferase family protein [Candidatus Thiodiazotropha sp.]
MLYFSYGSNMSSRRLSSRVAAAEFVTIATLHGHELVFHKKGKDGSAKCDAFETNSNKQFVMGVVYKVSNADRVRLDRIEGVGKGYERKAVEIVTPLGKPLAAYTYYATHIDATLKPFDWYRHHVITGALEYELPNSYIDSLRNIDTVQDPDSARHALEMSVYDAVSSKLQ